MSLRVFLALAAVESNSQPNNKKHQDNKKKQPKKKATHRTLS
jgi:hypothetical protein